MATLLEIYQAMADMEEAELTSAGLTAAYKTIPDGISGASYPFTMRNPNVIDPGRPATVGTKEHEHVVDVWLIVGAERSNSMSSVIEYAVTLGEILAAAYKERTNAFLGGLVKQVEIGKGVFTLLQMYNEFHWGMSFPVTVTTKTRDV